VYIGLHIKYPLLLSDFNKTIFLDRFSKINQVSIFIKIRPVGTELFNADGRTGRQTGMMKLTVAPAILRMHLKRSRYELQGVSFVPGRQTSL